MLRNSVRKHGFLILNALRIIGSFVILKYLAAKSDIDYIEYNRYNNLLVIYSSYILLNSLAVFTFPINQAVKNTLMLLSICVVILLWPLYKYDAVLLILLIIKVCVSYLFGIQLYRPVPDRYSSQIAMLLSFLVFFVCYHLYQRIGLSLVLSSIVQLVSMVISVPFSSIAKIPLDQELRGLLRPILVALLVGFVFNIPSLIYLYFGPYESLEDEVVFKSLVVSMTILSVIQTNYFFVEDLSIRRAFQSLVLLGIALTTALSYIYFITSKFFLSWHLLWLIPLSISLVYTSSVVRKLKFN